MPSTGEALADSPAVVLRRKERDYAFPVQVGSDPYVVYDDALYGALFIRPGGGYYFVGDGVSLQSDLLACHHSLGRQLLADLRGTVTQGQTSQAVVQFSEALRLNPSYKEAEENLHAAKTADAQLFPAARR